MKNFLIVVDMQKDFIDGTLGSKEAVSIVDSVCEKIKNFRGEIFVTLDTHYENYMDTSEGKKLPVPHCIKGTSGWELNAKVNAALSDKKYTVIEKNTFGSVDLPDIIRAAADGENFSATLIGLCTDICVVSNALLLKVAFPSAELKVDPDCCAGVTPDTHKAALVTMQSCQIDIIEV